MTGRTFFAQCHCWEKHHLGYDPCHHLTPLNLPQVLYAASLSLICPVFRVIGNTNENQAKLSGYHFAMDCSLVSRVQSSWILMLPCQLAGLIKWFQAITRPHVLRSKWVSLCHSPAALWVRMRWFKVHVHLWLLAWLCLRAGLPFLYTKWNVVSLHASVTYTYQFLNRHISKSPSCRSGRNITPLGVAARKEWFVLADSPQAWILVLSIERPEQLNAMWSCRQWIMAVDGLLWSPKMGCANNGGYYRLCCLLHSLTKLACCLSPLPDLHQKFILSLTNINILSLHSFLWNWGIGLARGCPLWALPRQHEPASRLGLLATHHHHSSVTLMNLYLTSLFHSYKCRLLPQVHLQLVQNL